MFWDSVFAGLKVLTYWETYIAVLEYLAILFIPMAVVGTIIEKSEAGEVAAGCLGILLLPILQVTAVAVFILTLAPIIFGFADDAAWSLPWIILIMAPGVFFKLVGVMIVTAIALSLIPAIGNLSSVFTLVLGGIALVFVLSILDSGNIVIVSGRVDFVPDFWFFVGLLVIGGVVSWVGMMVAAVIATALDIAEEGIGQLLMFPIGAMFGFIPVFMYGAWLGAQVRGAV